MHIIKNIQTQGRFSISIVLQGFIAEPDRKWTREELPRISEGYAVDDIQSRCIIMNKVSYQQFIIVNLNIHRVLVVFFNYAERVIISRVQR